MPPCFHLIRGLPSDTADFYASLHAHAHARPEARLEGRGARPDAFRSDLVSRAPVEGRSGCYDNMQETEPLEKREQIRRSVCHAAINSRTPNDSLSQLMQIYESLLFFPSQPPCGSDHYDHPSSLGGSRQPHSRLENRQLTCHVQNQPIPSSSVASYHRVARSTSHPSTRGQRIAARRA